MLNADVLRSLRYALQINNYKIVETCELAGVLVTEAEIFDFLRPEEDPDALPCPDEVLAGFLDGVIYRQRGKDESRPMPPFELPVTNNLVLKKLRVAFQLREEDILELFTSQGFSFGKAELSAVLRKKGHPNYRECGDQALRNFLKALTVKIHEA
ncbi:MAG: DUF1456 family protein [Proteobacteria bacterium]|nr:MAG: DUF1456 family protein [Pseudomonadota bacterium]